MQHATYRLTRLPTGSFTFCLYFVILIDSFGKFEIELNERNKTEDKEGKRNEIAIRRR